MFTDKNILIGVGGGIAVYRIAELVRLLKKQGARVRLIMSASAQKFVSPLTFEALSGEEVHTELFDLTSEREMGHIRLARWADVLLIAPATADLITKLAYGIADDLLTTLFQARNGPVILAPAMNAVMWESPACRRNVHILQDRGLMVIGPEEGKLACGEEGPGRLSEPETLAEAIYHAIHANELSRQRWLINAGPTIEHWDAVRYLTNAASGKLGFQIALAAAARGAKVDLVAGPGTPAAPLGVQIHKVHSAADMLETCTGLAIGADVFVATAGVTDFHFSATEKGKLKREDAQNGCMVKLVANVDVVAAVANMQQRPKKVIAFALECSNHVANAGIKLQQKGVDAVFANDAANMGRDTGAGWWLNRNDVTKLEPMPKYRLAEHLIDLVECLP